VRVTARDGSTRTYEAARSVTRDGNANLELRDDAGEIVAFRRENTVEEVEVIFG
jgi:hypothetical protein